MTMFDFLVEIKAMNEEIEEENKASEQRSQQMQNQMRLKHGR